MQINIINIGYGNMIYANKIIAILNPNSAPIKRIVQEAKEKGMLMDASQGRKTRSVVVMDNQSVILSSLQPETIVVRIDKDSVQQDDEE